MIILQIVVTVIIFIFFQTHFRDSIHYTLTSIVFIVEIIVVWGYFLNKFKLGTVFRMTKLYPLIRGYFVTIGSGGILMFLELLFLQYIFKNNQYSFQDITYFLVTDLVFLIVFKYYLYFTMRRMRRQGKNSRNIIIAGDVDTIPFIKSFRESGDWGYNLKAIATNSTLVMDDNPGVRMITDQKSLHDYLIEKSVDDIFYCFHVGNKDFDVDKLIKLANEIGISLHIKQEDIIDGIYRKNLNAVLEQPMFITHKKGPTDYFLLKVKEIFDIVFSLLLVSFLSPLFLLLGLLIYKEDKGPVFFKQQRIGLNGRRFMCYKFRTMVVNAEDLLKDLEDQNESDGPTFKIENDPRITKIGRFLRKTSLDELPQFINVIKGEMSIVGPRPPLLSEVKQYERVQLRRLSMKPGISCLWQVSGRNKLSFKQWMELDLKYIDNWSFWMDIKIIFKTIGVIFKADGK